MTASSIVAVTVIATVADEIDGKVIAFIGIHRHGLEITALVVREGSKDAIRVSTVRLAATQTIKNPVVLSSPAQLYLKVVKTNLDVISDRPRLHLPDQCQAKTHQLKLQWFHL